MAQDPKGYEPLGSAFLRHDVVKVDQPRISVEVRGVVAGRAGPMDRQRLVTAHHRVLPKPSALTLQA